MTNGQNQPGAFGGPADAVHGADAPAHGQRGCRFLFRCGVHASGPSSLPEDLLMEGSQVGEETAADVPADDEEVRAIIILEDPSLVDRGYSTLNLADNQAALTYSDKLMAGQEVALQRIQTQVLKGQPLDVAYRFTIGVNGIAITAP